MSFVDISIYVNGVFLQEKTSLKLLKDIKFYEFYGEPDKNDNWTQEIMDLSPGLYFNVKSLYVNDSYFLHSEDGPSIIYNDGSFCWYRNGYRHRDGGPTLVFFGEYACEYWYKNGLIHREDGPAFFGPNFRKWFLDGKEVNQGKFRNNLLEKYYNI